MYLVRVTINKQLNSIYIYIKSFLVSRWYHINHFFLF